MTETYSKSVDFGNELAPGQLANEIDADVSITTALLRIDVDGDTVYIVFQSTITGGEKTALDAVVAAHVPAITNNIFSVPGYIELISSLADTGSIRIQASNAAGGIDIDAGTGGIAIDTTNAISLDAGALINITTTAGNIELDTPGLIDINGQSGINIGNDADAAPVNIGTGSAVKAVTLGNNTAGSTVSILGGAGTSSVIVNTAGGLDVDATDVINLATGSSAGGAITLDAAFAGGGINLSSGAQGIAINSGTGLIGIGHWSAGEIQIGTSATARTITTGNTTGATAVNINTGTGGSTITTTGGNFAVNSGGSAIIDASGVVEFNSSGGQISIANDAVNQNVNIATAGSRVTTIGNTNSASAVNIISGTWGLTVGNDASSGEVQICSSANAKTIILGNATGGSRTFQRWGAGGHITHQPAHTLYSNNNQTATVAHLLNSIITMTPTTNRIITLPTAVDAVSGISSITVNDCIDFHIINQGNGAQDPTITIAMGTGGTAIGRMAVDPPLNNAGTNFTSGTGTFRLRFTNVTSSSEAYTVYRIS